MRRAYSRTALSAGLIQDSGLPHQRQVKRQMDSSQKQEAVEIISVRPSKEALINLISWLDLECSKSSETSLPQQILARAVVALGRTLTEIYAYKAHQAVAHTTQAAETFALEPTEENFAEYYLAATNSYPFGPGDGCYALQETGYAGCEPGSGCHSGSGCLYIREIEEASVMQIIARQLVPWLQGENDLLTRE